MTYLVKSLATPIIWIIGFLILGLVLLARCRKKWVVRLGWSCSLFGALLLLALSSPLVANRLVYSLECRYTPPSPEILSTLDIVVILPSNPRCESLRLLNGIRIFRQSSAQMLALPGGNSAPEREYAVESPKTVAVQMGVPKTQIVTQGLSHTTMEDAIEAGLLIPAKSECRIGVVTCALHMLRAKWAFEQQFPGDKIVPIPIGHRYVSPSFGSRTVVPSIEAFHNSTRALHEWIGLGWYSLRHAEQQVRR